MLLWYFNPLSHITLSSMVYVHKLMEAYTHTNTDKHWCNFTLQLNLTSRIDATRLIMYGYCWLWCDTLSKTGLMSQCRLFSNWCKTVLSCLLPMVLSYCSVRMSVWEVTHNYVYQLCMLFYLGVWFSVGFLSVNYMYVNQQQVCHEIHLFLRHST